MGAPEARLRIGGCDVHLLGTVAGFVPDGERVKAAIAADAPDTVALGIPAEDLAALDRLRGDAAAAEEMAAPDDKTDRFLELLARFGATRVPSPDFEAGHDAARAGNLRLVAVDLDDQTHSAEYVRRVKVRHLWWAPRRERRVLRESFAAARDAYELARMWDEAMGDSAPLREIEAVREEAMARGIREASVGSGKLVAVVPAARFGGVEKRLRQRAAVA